MEQGWERIRSLYADAVKTGPPPLTVVGALLAISLFGLAVSLFGLYKAFTMPKQTERQRSVPVVSYQQDGKFDYTVFLKDNSLFDTNALEPGQVYFRRLVDRIQGTFSYSFSSEPPVPEAAFNCRATFTFGSPDLWEEEKILTDTLKTQKQFSLPFDFAIQEFQNQVDIFNEQTGLSLSSPQLTVHVQVEPQIQTQYGPITEPFEQALVFSFEDETIRGGKELDKSQSDSITEMRRESTLGLERRQAMWLKVASGIGAAVSIYFLGLLGWLYVPLGSPVSEQERELQRARKRLQGLLVQTNRLPPVKEEEVVVRLKSLEELLDLAEEMFRPVMCSANEDGAVYCMIDGLSSMRYEYASRYRDGDRGR